MNSNEMNEDAAVHNENNSVPRKTQSTYSSYIATGEKEDSFEIEVAAPGLEKSDFKVTIEKDHLTISSEKKESDESSIQNFKRKEYNFQKFTRRFRLPNTVDKSSLKAKYLQGILKIVILKTPEAKEKGPRTINID